MCEKTIIFDSVWLPSLEPWFYFLFLIFLFLAETKKALEAAPIHEHEAIRAVMAAKHKKQLVDVDMKLVKQLDQKASLC